MKLTFKRTILNESQGTNFLQSKKEIESWLKRYNFQNFEIHDDLTVTINGPFAVSNNLTEIPFKLRKCGSIDVTMNKLKRIDWAPEEVDGDFDLWDNEIETLEGGPKIVSGSFDCDNNKLKDLIGAPQHVGGSFVCSKNTSLTSLKGCPETVGKYFKAIQCAIEHLDALPSKIGTNLYLQSNRIPSLKGINRLLKSLGEADEKTGVVNIGDNPITNGFISLMSVKGIKTIKHSEATKSKASEVVAIVNRAIPNGADPFDTQEELIDQDLGQYS